MHSRSFFFSSSPPCGMSAQMRIRSLRVGRLNADAFAFSPRALRANMRPLPRGKFPRLPEYFPSAFRIFLRPLLAPHLKDGKRAPSVFEFYFMRGIWTRLRRPGIAGCAPISQKNSGGHRVWKNSPATAEAVGGKPGADCLMEFPLAGAFAADLCRIRGKRTQSDTERIPTLSRLRRMRLPLRKHMGAAF